MRTQSYIDDHLQQTVDSNTC